MAGDPRVRLSQRAFDALACPICRHPLKAGGDVITCSTCHEAFPVGSGQIDLRPTQAVDVEVTFSVDTQRPVRALDRVGALPLRPSRDHRADAIGLTHDQSHGAKMSPALFTHLPDLPDGGGMILDLGCGEDATYAPLLRSTGFDYVGLDVSGWGPDIIGDAHRLPFLDGSIDAVVAISVLEHLRLPAVALREIIRVLKPGGVLIGSVALVEPFHMESYLHHTHLGTLEALADAGFHVEHVAPTEDWSGLQAFAEMALFPGFRRTSWLVSVPIVRTIQAFSWIWWRVVGRMGRLSSDRAARTLLLASGFRYVAHKPPAPTDAGS